ncbi:MAG: GAF domain-containing sensor histidine kinase [Gemmatimonadetes bacterium]|nr:GAF domain-containing sensor histidine kinase [Gemmatimonadota bacterium]
MPAAPASAIAAPARLRALEVGLGSPWKEARGSRLTHSFCQHVVASGEPLVVEDAPHHPLVHDNLAIAGMGVIAYAGMPLRTEDGEVLGSFCTVDTTPRVWSPEELGILEDLAAQVMTELRLRTTLRELERVAAIKNKLIGVVSHEIRNPLTAIVAALHMAALTRAPGEDSAMVDIALANAERLVRLSNALLDLERVRQGGAAFVPRPCATTDLLHDVARAMQPVAVAAGLRIEVDEGSFDVLADADEIAQVLANLIGNAIKFSPPGSAIELSARRTDAAVELHVRDHGRGIPADKVHAVFEEFVQVESADRQVKGGAGLGLSICRSIVERHDGRIWAESTPGEGSTFIVALPPA